MKTDKFTITENEIDLALDKVERIAACYDFKPKDLLKIRLISEETISIVSPTLRLSAAYIWVSTDEDSFSVTIECDADIDKQTRDEILSMNRGEKRKGVLGMVTSLMEYLSETDIDYIPMDYNLISPYGMNMSAYSWSNEFTMPLRLKNDEAVQEKRDTSLEASIVEEYADDIRVMITKGKSGRRLCFTVVKKFGDEQKHGFVIQ